MAAEPLSVLVVEDADVLRAVASYYLDSESDLQVVASVSTSSATTSACAC